MYKAKELGTVVSRPPLPGVYDEIGWLGCPGWTELTLGLPIDGVVALVVEEVGDVAAMSVVGGEVWIVTIDCETDAVTVLVAEDATSVSVPLLVMADVVELVVVDSIEFECCTVLTLVTVTVTGTQVEESEGGPSVWPGVGYPGGIVKVGWPLETAELALETVLVTETVNVCVVETVEVGVWEIVEGQTSGLGC
jgi:hypothetical protein